VFLGHVALGFAAKRAVPATSMALLVLAAQLADAIWPLLVGLGLEHVEIDPGNTRVTPLNFVSYPYSHSLATMALYGVAFGWMSGRGGGPERAALRERARDGIAPRTVWIIAALVVSHWLLDFITHRPDMPLYPGGPKVGLGLWNSLSATLIAEFVMYAAGVWLYLKSTRARDPIGRWAFASLAAFLPVVYLANIFGPPPPSVTAIWVGASVGAALLTVWAWWADRHRRTGNS
jgi:hypothetical protein